MSEYFRELDYRETPIGALSLRRRREFALGVDVWEIKLGDEFLMSSLFTASEIALARLGIGACAGAQLDVAIGGLGLGYTAQAALEQGTLRSLVVVEFLEAVIAWHREGLLPLGAELAADPRCRFVHGDFFALTASAAGLDPQQPGRRFHAILVDIDHSPHELLDARSAAFYAPAGLACLLPHLHPGGVFGLWSNSPPEEAFTARLVKVFGSAWAEEISFYNPLQNRPCIQTVYLARATAGIAAASG